MVREGCLARQLSRTGTRSEAMDDKGTVKQVFTLPAVQEAPRELLMLVHAPAHADFLSQLIAARQHLPAQRERRRAPVGQAVDAYANGSKITVRRMPAGYRKTIVT
jgi:hypothetical protein